MAFRSYGGLTWGSQEAEPYNSTGRQAASLAVAAGLVGAAFYGSTRTMASGRRPIDWVAGLSRTAGNLSPFQLGNTFRVPEALSPFTSLPYKIGDESTEGVTSWGRDYLKNESTYEWIKYTTGKSRQELEAAGITRGMRSPNESALASELIWEQQGSSTKGSLYSVVGDQRNLLSRDTALLAISEEILNPLTDKRGVNAFASAIFAAGDMHTKSLDSGEFKDSDVMRGSVLDPKTGLYVSKRASFVPMPSIAGDIDSIGDIGRRSTYARGTLSFSMMRFNRLVGQASEQFLGESGSKAFFKLTGFTADVTPGPASAMFARFGSKAAVAGGLYMGVQTLDWARRQGGFFTNVPASAAVAAGVGLGVGKIAGGRVGVMSGVASFFGQVLLPGFDRGVVEGVATTAVNIDMMRANSLNPFNYLRRTLEGFAPGITDAETGAGLSIAALAATTMQLPGNRGTIAQAALEKFGPDTFGLGIDKNKVRAVGLARMGTRRRFWERVGALGPGPGLTPSSISEKFALVDNLANSAYKGRSSDLLRDINIAWSGAEQDVRGYGKKNPMNEALESRLRSIANKYSSQQGTTFSNAINAIKREGSGFAAQAYYSFFGADIGVDKQLRSSIQDMGFGRLGRMASPTGRLGRLASVGAAVFGLHGVLTGGLLGSKETFGDLKDIYSGKKLVAVKSSRFWEAGGTPFEGGETEYYRPHSYHMMMNRTREKGTWGSNEDSIPAVAKFFLKNFTYSLEESQYWDRPYPISSAAFSDVPIIGGMLASTVGQLIKPAKIMHAGEWIREGEGGELEYASVYRGSRREPAMDLGVEKGAPQNPFGLGSQASFMNYQFRELEGMTGWAKNTIQQAITGSDTWGTDSPMLADASLMTSPRVRFWEANMGGALFTNEFVRRIFPSYRSDVERVNPIANSMPSWLPDKFKWGDPYRSVEWGEARLPGSGYASLHPELQGVDPEAYPLLYKYAILSDVAPLTHEYSVAKQAVYKRRLEGSFSQREIQFMEDVDARHLDAVSGFNDDRLHDRAIALPGSGVTQQAWGFGQRAMRRVAAPAEYLVPMGFRPVQKLAGDRDAIEQYEYERMYGTQMAFWDKPVRDWLRPSAYSAMNMLGWEGKPMWRREADANNEYFDKLEYVKWMNLEQQALAVGDSAAAQKYRWAASNTRTGVNPQGSPLGIYWTLPDSERKFFNAFAQASGQDRTRILEMMPEDQAHLYKAIWSRSDAGDESLWAGESSSVDPAYLASRQGDVGRYMQGQPTPSQDWVGWHEDVDMGDIQVRYIDRIGAELHDYGLWESQLKKSMQQSVLEGSDSFLSPQNAIKSGLLQMTGGNGQRGSWQVSPWGGTMSNVQISYNDNRHTAISSAVENYISGY